MHLTFGHSIALLIAAAILAAGATWWLYRSTHPVISTSRRWVLGSIRFLILATILFLLLEPVLTLRSSHENQPVLAVLIDDSQSIPLNLSAPNSPSADSGGSNVSLVLEQINRITGAIARPGIEYFGFGARTMSVDNPDSLRFGQSRTDIYQALETINTRSGDTPGAVILISDGKYNSGRNPIHLADTYPVPIFSVVLGDSTRQKDIRVQQALFNELSYVDTEVPVRVYIRNEGFDPTPIVVSLSSRGRRLVQRSVLLPESGTEKAVDFSFTPAEAGLFEYQIDISKLNGELTYRNNTERISLRILDKKRSVLVLAGGPSPDLSSIRAQLEGDANTRLIVRTRKKSGSYYEGPIPTDSLRTMDLIIMLGYPTARTPGQDLDALIQRFDARTPLLFIWQRSADLSTLRSRFSAFLPAIPDVIRPGFLQASFVRTPLGERHAIFDGGGQDLDNWERLPPLTVGESRWKIAAGGKMLASTEIRNISLDDPMLAVRRTGRRRSAAILASGFWRWQNVPDSFREEARKWDVLFSNLIQWLVSADDDRPVRVRPLAEDYAEGERIVFGAQVYDERLVPVGDASVDLRIVAPTGEEYPFTLRSSGSGRYQIDIGTLPPGLYTYDASALRKETVLGTDQGSFVVGALNIEFRSPGSDALLMRQIALRSGGHLVQDDQLRSLSDELDALPSLQPVQVNEVRQIRLWRQIVFLALALVLMTLEWFLRKRSGMI